MKLITLQQMNLMGEQAAQLPRLRTHHLLHDDKREPVQRMTIAMEPGTYIRPHRHPHGWELLTPLRGRFVVLQFDDRGAVTRRIMLGEENRLLEMPANVWHTVLSVDAGGVLFEVKPEPYQPLAAEDCMTWAPPEGGDGIDAVLRWYATAQEGDRYPG
ncbi:Tryptophan synthase beta chain like [Serratia rubidaea]|uniref:WbuC family cupin fold metalloprotein n=1 Tax=Serratia rubidaea TaxID=61652 RepID=UPI000774821D|nr:WbuC family cupin fold metalloprotein [Serratia rubidaea]AML56114.1 Tryptophan synthase beta chain like [Serratia rubidaea]